MRRLHRISRNANLLVLIFILCLSFFFRFYKINDYLFWGMDQEYEAFLSKNIITGKHFPLIGVNASDTGIYLGPFFIYFASIPFAIFAGNPLGWAFTASLLGVITTFSVYLVGKKIFSKETGLISSFFYGGSVLVSLYDRQFWNPMPIPLLSLIIGYLIWTLLNNKIKNLIWLSFVYSIAIQCHLSVLIFLPLILYIIWKKRKIITLKILVYSIAVFIILQFPVIIFDLRHNFINSKAVLNLLHKSSAGITSSFIERTKLFISSLGRFILPSVSADWLAESGQCRELYNIRKDSLIPGAGIILLLLFLKYYSKIKLSENEKGIKIIKIIFVLTFLFLLFYQRQIFEYYFLYFFPWFSLLLGVVLKELYDRIKLKPLFFILITGFLLLNLSALISAKFSYSYKDKTALLKFSKEIIGGSTYELEALGDCTRFGGYRYLSEYYHLTPLKSYMDSYFSWLYPNEIYSQIPSKILLLSLIDPRLPEDRLSIWQEEKLRIINQNQIIAQKASGIMEVYILYPKILNNEK